jgi:SAM-dependent methyltransferase
MHDSNGHFCKKCGNLYTLETGYVDFVQDPNFYAGEVSKMDMQNLLRNIDLVGYNDALSSFFEVYPALRNYIVDHRRADWIAHCISRNNERCLDIGSGLGNISETLSHIYHEMYSLEAVKERIEFQRRRFENSGRTNITLVRGNALELPFPDDYFDLVVCNGVLEWIGMLNKKVCPRQAQISFINEVKRVLNNKGCLYIGIENRFGIQYLLGQRDHSGLKFTSIIPRRLADILVRKFGPEGGIYGGANLSSKQGTEYGKEHTSKKPLKKDRGYHTFTYSLRGYHSLLKQAGFSSFKSYWVFPSYQVPSFSGKLGDSIAIKGFLHFTRSINLPRFKMAIPILEKVDKHILSFFTSLLIPSFLFYCYKENIPESFEEILTKNSAVKSMSTFSGDKDLCYVLYDAKGKPSNVGRLQRYGYGLPNTTPRYDKRGPWFGMSHERGWIENWIQGRRLKPLTLTESRAAINWLIEFQERTRSSNMMSRDEIHFEVESIRQNLLTLPHLYTIEYERWLDDYELYVSQQEIHRPSEHGNFFHSNILFNSKSQVTEVIDWKHFRSKGDPFFDFILFLIYSCMADVSYKHCQDSFEQNLSGHGKYSKILFKMQELIGNYFNFELDMQRLIRFVLLRYTVRTQIESGEYDQTALLFKNLLRIVSKS